jgi:hypothetical protein
MTLRFLLPIVALALTACSQTTGPIAGSSTSVNPGEPHPGITRFTESLDVSRAPSEAPLSVVAELDDPRAPSPVVRFKVTNLQRQPVSIDVNTLPWMDDGTVEMTGIRASGQIMPVVPYLGGLVAQEPPRTLAPGESISGERALEAFAVVEPRPRRADALLLWSYRRDGYLYTGLMALPK